MKKLISTILVCLVGLGVISFSPRSLASNAVDQIGNDPWLTLFHDSQNTATSAAAIKMPLKEGFLWEKEGGDSSFFPSPPLVHNNILYIPYMADSRGRFPYMADSRGRSAEIIAMDYSSGDPEEIWRAEFEGLMFSSPILDPENEKLFLMVTGGFGTKDQGTNSTVYCVSMADGSEEWTSQVDGASFSSLAFDSEKNLLFLSTFWTDKEDNEFQTLTFDYADSEGAFYCLDAEAGDIMWEAELDGGSLHNAAPAINNGIVYVTNRNFWYSSKGYIIPAFRSSPLYAFDEEDGSLLWTYQSGENTGFTGSPTISDDKVYVCMSFGGYESGIQSTVTCLDAESGEEEWTYEYTNFSVNFAPAVTEDFVFFIAADATLYALNRETGKKSWSKKHQICL